MDNDAPSFLSVTNFLHNCCQTRNFRAIKKCHAHLLRTGLLCISLNLQVKLSYAYSTCLRADNVQTLTNFLRCLNPTNPSPFNSAISNFCRNGSHFLGIQTFSFMHFRCVPIDSYTLCSSLASSSCTQNVTFGKQLHSLVERSGWLSSVFVASALIDFYAKSFLINDATALFDEIPVRNTVCANALLFGHAQANMWMEGLELVRKMPKLNLNTDNFTLTAALVASVGLSTLEMGRQLHASVIRTVPGAGPDVFVQTLLIEMYGKCGLEEKAWQVFSLVGFGNEKKRRDIVLWTSMLGVYGKNGNFKEVITLFNDMLMEGIKPDNVAFLTVISACGYTGQVNIGMQYFESMARDFGLDQSQEHYSCLVDMLCRAGELNKAWELVKEMQLNENGNCTISMWGALLNACTEFGNVDIAEAAAQRALELDPENSGIYVLLSNVYARFGMWDKIAELRELMKGKKLKKDIGCSWIEVYG